MDQPLPKGHRVAHNALVQAQAGADMMKELAKDAMKVATIGSSLDLENGRVLHCVALDRTGTPIFSDIYEKQKREERLRDYHRTGLSPTEIGFLLTDPAVIDALITYHDLQADAAESTGFDGCAEFHNGKIAKLHAYKKELMVSLDAGDEKMPQYYNDLI